MNTQTQIQTDLVRAKSGLLREAQGLRDQMERLIERLEAGGTVNAMDSLGSRISQFEGSLSEANTLQNVMFYLNTDQMEQNIDAATVSQVEYDETDDVQTFLIDAEPLLCDPARMTQSQRYEQFQSDMELDGFEVEHYRGRCFYEGPSVRVSYFEGVERVIRATAITVQTDQMGLGFIVYPR